MRSTATFLMKKRARFWTASARMIWWCLPRRMGQSPTGNRQEKRPVAFCLLFARVSPRPFVPLVILERADHGAIGALGDAFGQTVLLGDRFDLDDDLLDPRRRADGGGI